MLVNIRDFHSRDYRFEPGRGYHFYDGEAVKVSNYDV